MSTEGPNKVISIWIKKALHPKVKKRAKAVNRSISGYFSNLAEEDIHAAKNTKSTT
jgi:hypothetical protein